MARDWETDRIAVLETNLDDLSGERLGHFVTETIAQGALDVFCTPIQMKKNRPGTMLTVLCAEEDADRFAEMILRGTTAFGVRRTISERRKLRRESVEVDTPHGKVEVKIGRLNGLVVQVSPEYESCRAVSVASGVSLADIQEAAVQTARSQL